MNIQTVIDVLEDYLTLLQEQDADDDKITQVKLLILAIEREVKLRQYLNNLTVTNQYYKRR
ncbi:hypothetical protein [uncultured Acinetobacter sp.]|uniref:hypothetical protein n=1 Tax=uncultured Acinetobacter sp. TaxID=165433 RepID=UPI0037498FF2